MYDQDANHSRRFTQAEFGASLKFIAICYIEYFLFVGIWTSLGLVSGFLKNKDFMRGLRLEDTNET